MTAVMRILGWKAEGLRCPDHEIDCCNATNHPHTVTLVQMPNGTGKTTTLELLRAALSGSAADGKWDRARIREFRKKDSATKSGSFEVRLLLNDRRATVRIEFDFESERIYYKTTQGPGQGDGFHPPSAFRRFMHEDFVKFYVFDGELAQQLLDRQFTNAESVVENLFQISSFNSITHKVDGYWERKTQHVGASEPRGLNRRRNKLAALIRRREQLLKERTALRADRSTVSAQLQSKEDAYNQEIRKEETRAEELKVADARAETLRANVREESLEVLEYMRDPHALSATFANGVLELKTGLDRVKLPERAAREFFEELADEPSCVCGRPIDDEIRNVIRERAGQYLGSDDVALLNAMKTSIHDAVGSSTSAPGKVVDKKLAGLSETVTEYKAAQNDVEALRLDAEQSDPAVKRARDEIDALTQRLATIDEGLEKYESKDKEQGTERTFGIDVIEQRIKTAEDKLAEISETMDLKAKRDALRKILKAAHRLARDAITAEICADANSRITGLMPHNNIVIDRIDQCLVLRGQEGGSAGETLSVAWGFLATLFHRSEHELPFVVDSPAGPIDLAVRPRIGELIPHLTGQFIAFTISSEREQFVAPLKAASNEPVQFLTVFRKGSQSLDALAKQSKHVVETDDGLCLSGEDFFSEFQLDAEEAG